MTRFDDAAAIDWRRWARLNQAASDFANGRMCVCAAGQGVPPRVATLSRRIKVHFRRAPKPVVELLYMRVRLKRAQASEHGPSSPD